MQLFKCQSFKNYTCISKIWHYMYIFLQKIGPCEVIPNSMICVPLFQAELLMWNMLKPIPIPLQIYTHKRTKKVQNTHNLTKLEKPKVSHTWFHVHEWSNSLRNTKPKGNHNTISTTCHLSLEMLQVRPLAPNGYHQEYISVFVRGRLMFLLSPAHTPSRSWVGVSQLHNKVSRHYCVHACHQWVRVRPAKVMDARPKEWRNTFRWHGQLHTLCPGTMPATRQSCPGTARQPEHHTNGIMIK